MKFYLTFVLIISFLYFYAKTKRDESIHCIKFLEKMENPKFYLDKTYKSDYSTAGFSSNIFSSKCSFKMTSLSFHKETIDLFNEVKTLINNEPLYYKDEFKFQFLNNNIVFNVKTSGINIMDTFFIKNKI